MSLSAEAVIVVVTLLVSFVALVPLAIKVWIHCRRQQGRVVLPVHETTRYPTYGSENRRQLLATEHSPAIAPIDRSQEIQMLVTVSRFQMQMQL